MIKPLEAGLAVGLDAAFAYVLKDPAHNASKLVDWAEAFDKKGAWKAQLDLLRPIANDPENIWNKFLVNLCNEIDHDVLKTTFRNFFCERKLAWHAQADGYR